LANAERGAIVEIAARPSVDEVVLKRAERFAGRIELMGEAVDEFAAVGSRPVRSDLGVPIHPWHPVPFPDLIIFDVEAGFDIALQAIVEKCMEVGSRVDRAAILEANFQPRIIFHGRQLVWIILT
jgi:hypothetical protein